MFQALVVCVAAIGADTGAVAGQEEPRPFHVIQAEISDLLKRESAAKQPAARAAIVCRMCELHGEILHDPRYAASDTLAEYRGRLWSRLRRVQADLKHELARSTDKNDKQAVADNMALAAADGATLVAANSLANSLSLLDQSQGGPGYLMALGGRAVPPDYGPELVDLIEQTINPAFWDVVGGPGSIVYYAPLRCLVVRATAEVHGNVGSLIGGLRDAGR